MVTVDVFGGICTGRNGTVEISGIAIGGFDRTIRIDCISKKRKVILNAGFRMRIGSAERFAKQLLQYCKDCK